MQVPNSAYIGVAGLNLKGHSNIPRNCNEIKQLY